MEKLGVKYMGFELRSPLILGSCGLSNSTNNLEKAEKAGFGAVVLKSIFEEEILREVNAALQSNDLNSNSQAFDYISQYQENASFAHSLERVKKAKSLLSIPVIASINCFSAGGWTKYAKAIEEAGADALELNYFILPTSFDKTAQEYADGYFKLIEEARKHTKMPIALKTSYFFTDFAHFAQQLSYTGIDALVLFNRFHSPDIDINDMKFTTAMNLSTSAELPQTLRWIGLLGNKLRCDLSATTGVHKGSDMVKLLLAGANTVQAASVFYDKGIEFGADMLQFLQNWMNEHQFSFIEDFRGSMSYANLEDPDAYFRIQFMKYMAGIE